MLDTIRKMLKGDGVASAQADVDRLKARESSLRERITAAEAGLRDMHERRRQMLTDGDIDAVDKMVPHTKLSAAETSLASMRAALAEIEQRHVAAEARLAGAKAEIERGRFLEIANAANDKIASALANYERATAELVDALDVVTAGRPLALALTAHAAGFVPEARALLGRLRQHEAAIASGAAAPALMHVVAPPAPAPPVERQRVYTLRQVRWIDDGPKTALRHAVIDLPLATAQWALAVGVVLRHDDPRINTISDAWGNIGVRAYGPTLLPLPAEECRDLDALAAPSAEIEEVAA